MAFWPRDERTENLSTQSQSVEKKRDYPYLEPGLIGAATLSPKTFGWTFFSNPSLPPEKDIIGGRLNCREYLEIFPPTRAVPRRTEKASTRRRAEQGANFLRVYLPDVEVASELIREQLSEDITLARKFERFDPYSGNVLEAFRNASNPRMSCILFPSGGTYCDLNSCLVDSSDHNVTFSPRDDPLWSFPTPIQHLALSRSSDVNNLAVRTFGVLQLFTLRYPHDGGSLTIDAHSAFSRSDFADETIVDMKFSSMSPKFLTIGHKGSLFESDFSSGTQAFNRLHHVDTTRSREVSSEFWRLSLDKNVHNKFILSTKEALQFDNRTSSINNILCLSAGKQVFTAIEDIQQENLLRLCSTNDLLWVDLRFPGKPLLAYAHQRAYDQYLTTDTINFPGQRPLTFLSCRNNALTTIYDVSHSTDGLIRLNQSPYGLSPTYLYDKHIGQLFLEDGISLGLVRLSERGGVSYHEIVANNGQIEREFVVRKSKLIREMEAAAPNLREDEPTLGAGYYSQVDMHEKYNALFNQDFLMKPEEHTEESLDKMLQLFPYCMQNHELPIEHILTAYDVAFRAGDEPHYAGRADFLTESMLNSTATYEALKEGRLAPAQVRAPWHISIASTLERLDEDFRSDPQQLMEHLQGFNLIGNDVPEYVRDLERAACQQLVLDLVLSSDIFSETKFSKAREVDHSLETMTEALSLGGEPPPIEFGYLQPLAPRPTSHEIADTPMQQPEMPPAVRLLLKDWDNGHPDRYVHRGPFKGLKSLTSEVTAVHNHNVVVQNQRPPPILPSRAVTLKSQSQEPMPSTRAEGEFERQVSQSQDFAISTQVLPGPFGGRPTKKKPTKKRLGGF